MKYVTETGNISVEDDLDNYEVVAANIKELYEASLKRLLKAESEASKAQGTTIAFNSSVLNPNPQDYESDKIDYVTALNNDINRRALHIHVMQDHQIVLQSSVYKNPNASVNEANSNNDTPFHVAGEFGRSHIWAEFFLRNNIKINAKNNQGNTVLHLYMTATMDEEERAAVVYLITHNRPDVDVNIKNRDTYTPLALAVWLNRYKVIGFLVKAGANLTGQAFLGGNTILHYSVFLTRMACTQILVAAGAPVNSTNDDGDTPLIMAMKAGNETVVTALLAGGADMEMRNKDGLRAVEMAVKNRNLASLKMLVARGAKLTPPKGSKGPTAVQIAREQGDQEMVNFLSSRGA